MDIDTPVNAPAVTAAAVTDFSSQLPSCILSLTTIDANSPVDADTTTNDSDTTDKNPNPQQRNDSLKGKCNDVNSHSLLNLTLLDPPRWGWSAAGGIVDVATPHDVRINNTLDTWYSYLIHWFCNFVCFKTFFRKRLFHPHTFPSIH
jgi:hypothetical protein